MTAVVWITGRAATGKSTLLATCLARLRHAGHAPLRLCDEELLFQLKHADTTHAHHYHPYGDRRFLFRDGYLFDEGLRRISAAVLAAPTSWSSWPAAAQRHPWTSPGGTRST